jgi:hypothetical protein
MANEKGFSIRTAGLTGGALAVTVGHISAMRFLTPGTPEAAALSAVVLLTISAAAATLCFTSVNRLGEANRRGLLLIGGAILCWFFGEVVWTVYVVLLRAESPTPSLADIGFLGFFPLAFSGLYVMTRLKKFTVRAFLDGLMISISLVLVCWPWLIKPTYQSTDLSVPAKVIALSYPVGDIALMAMVLIMTGRVHRGQRLPLITILIGASSLVVADIGFAYLSLHGRYECGMLIDSGWVAGFAFIALGASLCGQADCPPVKGDPGGLSDAFPYLPLGAALGVMICFSGQLAGATVLPVIMLVIVAATRQITFINTSHSKVEYPD